VIGQYDDQRSIVLPGKSLNGVPGVHLLTPLLLGLGDAVLVNRGWVPSADGATIPLDSFPSTPGSVTEVRLAGLLLPLPPPARPAPRDAAEPRFRRVWYRMDRDALQAQFPYRLLPAQLQLLPSPDAPSIPTRLQPPALSDGPHLSYAIQWFSFAAIGMVGWVALARRSRRERALEADESAAGVAAPVTAPGEP
jgi:surfeit locus 1 family protein